MTSAGHCDGNAPRIVEVEETLSTNSLALSLAADGERGPLWVSALRQTGGRGRSGRPWVSLPGNLHATLLLTPGCSVQVAPELSLVAGVALVEAIGAAAAGNAPAGLRLKWPNDVLVGAAKVGGILIESGAARPGGELIVAIGVGLDLAAHPDDPGHPATHLAAHGVAVDRETMLALLADRMAWWIRRWDEGRGFGHVRQAWEASAGPRGEKVSVHAGEARIEGRYAGLDVSGALLVTDESGRERRFAFGDVMLLDGTPGAREAMDLGVPDARRARE